MTAAEAEFAPAKVNLALHVTGRRSDGYHLLDSLVVFAPVGDTLSVAPAGSLGLSVDGPYAAAVPAGEDNVVLRAARLLGGGRGAAIRLTKRLPPASGIGGGSSDAAAALRALSRLWSLPLPATTQAVSLGADVPVCLDPGPSRMRGIGEAVERLAAPVPVWMVLVNPGVELATPAVFAALARRDSPPLPEPGPLSTPAEVAAYAARCRNDLEAPALSLSPVVGEVLAALRRTEGCLLARMSGSGATCFGLYPDRAARDLACAALSARRPDWWVACESRDGAG